MSYLVVLLLLLLGAALANYVWLSYDAIPPHWDAVNHMQSTLNYHTVLSEYFQSDLLSFRSLKTVLQRLVEVDQSVYPPLFPLVASVVLFFGGASIKWLTMVNLFFLIILLVAPSHIGNKLHDEKTALLACALLLPL